MILNGNRGDFKSRLAPVPPQDAIFDAAARLLVLLALPHAIEGLPAHGREAVQEAYQP